MLQIQRPTTMGGTHTDAKTLAGNQGTTPKRRPETPMGNEDCEGPVGPHSCDPSYLQFSGLSPFIRGSDP